MIIWWKKEANFCPTMFALDTLGLPIWERGRRDRHSIQIALASVLWAKLHQYTSPQWPLCFKLPSAHWAKSFNCHLAWFTQFSPINSWPNFELFYLWSSRAHWVCRSVEENCGLQCGDLRPAGEIQNDAKIVWTLNFGKVQSSPKFETRTLLTGQEPDQSTQKTITQVLAMIWAQNHFGKD